MNADLLQKLYDAVDKIAPCVPIETLPDGKRIIQVDADGRPLPRTGMRPAGDPFPMVAQVYQHREDFAEGIVMLANHAAELLTHIKAQESRWWELYTWLLTERTPVTATQHGCTSDQMIDTVLTMMTTLRRDMK